eukprot:8195473-Lingulodinium_polyedra.AAC.1
MACGAGALAGGGTAGGRGGTAGTAGSGAAAGAQGPDARRTPGPATATVICLLRSALCCDWAGSSPPSSSGGKGTATQPAGSSRGRFLAGPIVMATGGNGA